MDIIKQESSAGAIDPESLLTDAKLQILAMIADHVEFADRQVSPLQMLASSFTEIRTRQQSSDAPPDSEIAGLVESSILTARRERLDQQAKENAARLEHVGTLHTDMVQFFNGCISEIRHQMTLKDIQIAQLSVAAPAAQSGALRRTTISRPVDYGDEMSRAQRVILELQNQVINLRAGISTATSTMEVALRA
jgi:hypothetical protein